MVCIQDGTQQLAWTLMLHQTLEGLASYTLAVVGLQSLDASKIFRLML